MLVPEIVTIDRFEILFLAVFVLSSTLYLVPTP